MTHARALEIAKSYTKYLHKVMTESDFELLEREKKAGGFKGWRPLFLWIDGFLAGYEHSDHKKEAGEKE